MALQCLPLFGSQENMEKLFLLCIGMATGGFGTGHPYPIPIPKYLVISQTRPKPGAGRGIPIPVIELKLNPIPGPSRPGYVLSGWGGVGRKQLITKSIEDISWSHDKGLGQSTSRVLHGLHQHQQHFFSANTTNISRPPSSFSEKHFKIRNSLTRSVPSWRNDTAQTT